MKYKKWELSQKLEILTESEEFGIVETCRKYGVSTGTFYSWKKKFEHKGWGWGKKEASGGVVYSQPDRVDA